MPPERLPVVDVGVPGLEPRELCAHPSRWVTAQRHRDSRPSGAGRRDPDHGHGSWSRIMDTDRVMSLDLAGRRDPIITALVTEARRAVTESGRRLHMGEQSQQSKGLAGCPHAHTLSVSHSGEGPAR